MLSNFSDKENIAYLRFFPEQTPCDTDIDQFFEFIIHAKQTRSDCRLNFSNSRKCKHNFVIFKKADILEFFR